MPSYSPYAKTLEYDTLDKLKEGIDLYEQQGGIIVGRDINGKTNTANDFVSDANDNHSPTNGITRT